MDDFTALRQTEEGMDHAKVVFRRCQVRKQLDILQAIRATYQEMGRVLNGTYQDRAYKILGESDRFRLNPYSSIPVYAMYDTGEVEKDANDRITVVQVDKAILIMPLEQLDLAARLAKLQDEFTEIKRCRGISG